MNKIYVAMKMKGSLQVTSPQPRIIALLSESQKNL